MKELAILKKGEMGWLMDFEEDGQDVRDREVYLDVFRATYRGHCLRDVVGGARQERRDRQAECDGEADALELRVVGLRVVELHDVPSEHH